MRYPACLIVAAVLAGCSGLSSSPRVTPPAGGGRVSAVQWMSRYYLNPEPEKLVNKLRELHERGYWRLPGMHRRTIGFIGMVLRKQPDLATGLVEQCSFLTDADLPVLAYALWFADTPQAKREITRLARRGGAYAGLAEQAPPPLLDADITIPESLDMCWGSFCASGDTAYVSKVIDCLALKDSADPAGLLVYAAARWSLGANGREHSVVREHCEAELASRDDPVRSELREILDELPDLSPAATIETEAIEDFRSLVRPQRPPDATSDGGPDSGD